MDRLLSSLGAQGHRVLLSGLGLRPPSDPSGLGRADAILFRPFGPLAIQPLGQLGPVLLNGSRLRFGLLALVIKRLEFIASRGNLGLDLGQLSNCLLLLLALGQKLILTGFQVGQRGPEIRERPQPTRAREHRTRLSTRCTFGRRAMSIRTIPTRMTSSPIVRRSAEARCAHARPRFDPPQLRAS